MHTSTCRKGLLQLFRSFRCQGSGTLVLLLVIVILLPAGTAAAATGDGSGRMPGTGFSDGPALQDAGAGSKMVKVSPTAAITMQPTPFPARQNRTALVQIAKNIADRPRVTVPSALFYLIVAIAVTGLLAILYLLVRRGGGSAVSPPGAGKRGTGTATVIEDPPSSLPAEADGPNDTFPLALRKRFLHPEFIGEGGLARVFRACDVKTGATVAVKVPVRFDETTGTHFTRDISLWQGLEHENIIRILSSNILPVPYIEMEYAPSSLAALLLPVPEEKAVGILHGIARGLAYAHGKGIIHRDIKPENILLSADGIPKITDWGLGKAIGDSRQSTVIGFSPAYAAPEQIAPHRFGRPGPATDIYQMGMLLCELLTGAPAFHEEGMHDLNTSILEKSPVIPRWKGRYNEDLEHIIRRCLAKKPEDRYTSVADLIRDLEHILAFPVSGN